MLDSVPSLTTQQSALWILPTTPLSFYVIRPHYIAKAVDDCGYLKLEHLLSIPTAIFS